VIAFMVLSIIASLFAIPLIVISGIGIGSDRQYDFMLILYNIQLLTGLLQGVVAITTAAFSCRVVCCGRQRSNMGTVIYTNTVPQSVPLTAVIATGASEASGASGASVQPTATVDEKPPKYEDLETNEDTGEGDRYQRFDWLSYLGLGGKKQLFIYKWPRIWCLKNVNFVKNETLKAWILWKMILWKCEFCEKKGFWKCEFCEKWDFENVNFVKIETLKFWILWKVGFW